MLLFYIMRRNKKIKVKPCSLSFFCIQLMQIFMHLLPEMVYAQPSNKKKALITNSGTESTANGLAGEEGDACTYSWDNRNTAT